MCRVARLQQKRFFTAGCSSNGKFVALERSNADMSSPAPKYASNEGVADAIHALLTDAVVELVEAVGEISVTVQRETLPTVMVTLRADLAYPQLLEIAGVDYPDLPDTFDISTHML